MRWEQTLSMGLQEPLGSVPGAASLRFICPSSAQATAGRA